MITGYVHTVQLSVFIKAVGTGYIIGSLFALVMFFNSVNGKSTLAVFIRDVLFFISAAVMSFLFCLKYNAGIVRFYILAGELMGFCLFYIFPGSSFGKICRKAAKRCEKYTQKIKERSKKTFNCMAVKIKDRKNKSPQKKQRNRKERAKKAKGKSVKEKSRQQHKKKRKVYLK